MTSSKALTTGFIFVLAACAAHENAEPAAVTIQPLPTPTVTAPATASATPPKPSTQVRDDGLEIQDLRIGTGDELQPGDTATVHYVGTLIDGTQFDSSRARGQPFTSKIPGQLIKGWNEGMLGMHVGGLRRLIIPASLAYGDRPAGKIPAGSTLVFEIELLDVKAGTAQPRQNPRAPRVP